MGYLHIDNLYKDQTILVFKECYALEKIHGTSAHIRWNNENKSISLFSGGEKHEKFASLFDISGLTEKCSQMFESDVVIYGEAYGGKQQAMSSTYGKELKFVAFDVLIKGIWLMVPNAEKVCQSLGLEFVYYEKVSTDIESLNKQRDMDSVQAIRNGVSEGKIREGVVLRPLIEFQKNNGSRIISKHKRDEFKETKTPREVNPEEFKIMEDAKQIADEWVTEMRLTHVLDKMPPDVNIESTKDVITAMIEDVYREAKGEIIESREVSKFIGSRTALLFKQRLQSVLS